jgi:isoquinoline 1-oxidoreductase subunit beta
VIEVKGGKATAWLGCQMQTEDQAAIAKVLGLKPEDVALNTIPSGGSFGRRATPDSHWAIELAEISKAAGNAYPIQLIWSREDDIKGGYYRPMNFHRIKAGLDAQGTLIAWEQTFVGQSILEGTPFAVMMKDGLDPVAYEGAAPEQYGVANAAVRWVKPTVGVPVLWWRSVGHTHAAFSKEIMIDELAAAAGKDALAFRLSLLGEHPRHAGVLKLAAEKAGWGKRMPKGRGMGLAVHESFGSFVAQVAEVTTRADGSFSVDKVVCAVDCGFAINPEVVKAQMEGGIGYGLAAVLREKITLTNGAVDQSNFDSYPPLRIEDMPRSIEVHILNSGNKPSGVGEPGLPPIAPAIANALRMATGKPVRKLPLFEA